MSLCTEDKMLSIDDVLRVVVDLQNKETDNYLAFCSNNPGVDHTARSVARILVNDAYMSVYSALLMIAKNRSK